MAHGLWFLDEGLNLGPLHLERRVLATGPPGNSLIFYFYWTALVASRFSISLPGNPSDIKGIKEGGCHFVTQTTWFSDKESSVDEAVVFNLHWASESPDHWISESSDELQKYGCSVLCVPETLTQVVWKRAQYVISQKLPAWSSRGARVENSAAAESGF